MALCSFSAVEAGEPDDSAAEEKDVEEKEGERKAEKIASLAKVSRAEEAVVVPAAAGADAPVAGVLKVERRWRGEVGEEDRGDLWRAAGDAIDLAGKALSLDGEVTDSAELSRFVSSSYAQ